MKVIGLTGGIGTGKSSAAYILMELGAYIISADEIAKDVVKKGSKTLKELVDYFGEDILDESFSLNRKKLSEIVFNNSHKLKKLNEIVHKEVYKLINEELSKLNEKGFNGIVILDVPLPGFTFKELADKIWVVDAEEKLRIDRVIKRSGLSQSEVQKRINSQLTRDEYLKFADYVIENNGSIDELENEIRRLYLEESKN